MDSMWNRPTILVPSNHSRKTSYAKGITYSEKFTVVVKKKLSQNKVQDYLQGQKDGSVGKGTTYQA